MPHWMTWPGTTRCHLVASKKGRPGAAAVLAIVPSASPTKLAAVIGTRSKSSLRTMRPLFVATSAYRPSGYFADWQAEPESAAAARAMASDRASIFLIVFLRKWGRKWGT